MADAIARPFVKWAGGKATLVSEILARFPKKPPRRYFEPFVGGGAVFFEVRERWPDLECVIADTNAELMDAFAAVRDDVEALIGALERHREVHGSEHFYEVRAQDPAALSAVERAARFVYLNRTCFNGLYRVNAKGLFNVPVGRYRNPTIADAKNLRAVSAALRSTEVRWADFEGACADAGEGDVVYFDPPYQPLSESSHFTAYTAGGFGADQQLRLAAGFERLARRGARVNLSNSDTPFVRAIYGALRRPPKTDVLLSARSINSKADRRGQIRELLLWAGG